MAIDPDGVVARRAGEVATSLEVLEGATRRWMADPAARRPGERALASSASTPVPPPWAIAWLLSWIARCRHAAAAARPPGPEGALTTNLRGPRCPRLP